MTDPITSAVQDFQNHRSMCAQCLRDPFNLCFRGIELLDGVDYALNILMPKVQMHIKYTPPNDSENQKS